MPTEVAPNLLSWASDVDDNTIAQAARAAQLPFVRAAGHVALMADAHVGIGSTVGSVIPSKGAIVPSFAGVDLGCGMVASETDLTADDLPDTLAPLMPLLEHRIPAGVGRGHERGTQGKFPMESPTGTELSGKQISTMLEQFGTLGSGNHFVEVCLDERDHVWVVLHSGSRGIGNQLATRHINVAKGLLKQHLITLDDPDQAWLVEGTPEFKAYIADMLWAQAYALGSRAKMAEAGTRSLFEVVGKGTVTHTINVHHNFTQKEHHHGKNIWVTRKGAVKADVNDEGVIPGSMGTKSYIVKGKGNPASYNSSSHGAGRRMSRTRARKEITIADLQKAMQGKVWNDRNAGKLIDEAPASYKDVDVVMRDQADLVEITHTLVQCLNYKGQ